jgi:hypothetical protein
VNIKVYLEKFLIELKNDIIIAKDGAKINNIE